MIAVAFIYDSIEGPYYAVAQDHETGQRTTVELTGPEFLTCTRLALGGLKAVQAAQASKKEEAA